MRIAVISDIHGNLAALESVLASIRNTGADKVICLGDIVGYGARPNECVDLIKDRKIPTVMGNHDQAAVGRGNLAYFNTYARQAIIWTMTQLKDEEKRFLSGLELTFKIDDMLFVHSSPDNTGDWNYIFTAADAQRSFSAFQEPVCFIGHTHYPNIFYEEHGHRRLINVGSVGQPRDNNPQACWGQYDTSTGEYRLMRVEYDVELAVKDILDAQLPPFLANRLLLGT